MKTKPKLQCKDLRRSNYQYSRVMEWLQLVKDKQSVYDVMFEPLQEIIDVLSIYEVEIPERTLLQLQELPEK